MKLFSHVGTNPHLQTYLLIFTYHLSKFAGLPVCQTSHLWPGGPFTSFELFKLVWYLSCSTEMVSDVSIKSNNPIFWKSKNSLSFVRLVLKWYFGMEGANIIVTSYLNFFYWEKLINSRYDNVLISTSCVLTSLTLSTKLTIVLRYPSWLSERAHIIVCLNDIWNLTLGTGVYFGWQYISIGNG